MARDGFSSTVLPRQTAVTQVGSIFTVLICPLVWSQKDLCFHVLTAHRGTGSKYSVMYPTHLKREICVEKISNLELMQAACTSLPCKCYTAASSCTSLFSKCHTAANKNKTESIIHSCFLFPQKFGAEWSQRARLSLCCLPKANRHVANHMADVSGSNHLAISLHNLRCSFLYTHTLFPKQC